MVPDPVGSAVLYYKSDSLSSMLRVALLNELFEIPKVVAERAAEQDRFEN